AKDETKAQTWADKADCLRLWADGLQIKEKFTDSLAAADAALKLDSHHSMAHAVRGAVLTQLTRYDEALAALDAALDLDPIYYWGWKEKAKALYFRGHMAAALDLFTKLAGESTGVESLGFVHKQLPIKRRHCDKIQSP